MLIVDGAPWVRNRFVPALPADAIDILAWFQTAEHIAARAAERFGTGSRAAPACTRRICTGFRGRPPERARVATQAARKPHQAQVGFDSVRQAIDTQAIDVQRSHNPPGVGEDLARQLIDKPAEAGLQTALKALLGTVSHKVDRMDCPA